MRLTRSIPEQRLTLHIAWVKRDFLAMSEKYRNARKRSKRPMDSCHWCKHAFADGEMMALAQIGSGPNVVLCHGCVDQIQID